MDLPDYFLVIAAFLLVLVILLLYMLFRRTSERAVEESRLSVLLSRSRSMRVFLERLDEIDAELSILRSQVARLDLKVTTIEESIKKSIGEEKTHD